MLSHDRGITVTLSKYITVLSSAKKRNFLSLYFVIRSHLLYYFSLSVKKYFQTFKQIYLVPVYQNFAKNWRGISNYAGPSAMSFSMIVMCLYHNVTLRHVDTKFCMFTASKIVETIWNAKPSMRWIVFWVPISIIKSLL